MRWTKTNVSNVTMDPHHITSTSCSFTIHARIYTQYTYCGPNGFCFFFNIKMDNVLQNMYLLKGKCFFMLHKHSILRCQFLVRFIKKAKLYLGRKKEKYIECMSYVIKIPKFCPVFWKRLAPAKSLFRQTLFQFLIFNASNLM